MAVELAGVALDPRHRPDGVSMAAYLRGRSLGRLPREWILNEYHDVRVVRDARYKLYSDGRFFDANLDPEEKNDLAKSTEPSVIAARERLSQAFKSLPPDSPPPFPLRSLSAFKIRGETRAK